MEPVMFLEKQFEHWVTRLRGQLVLPLRLDLWNGQQFALSSECPKVVIRILHRSALNYLLTPSLASLGEAYVNGKIDVDGEASELIIMGNALASHFLKRSGRFGRLVRTFHHNKKRDSEAVRYHYDVSNEFYQCWLDENMVYSCAYFENGTESLATAQMKKIDHILTKIRLQPGHTLLDIGCGWGALVIRAAKKYGARCVGITLSENQAGLAKEYVKQAGLSDQIEIRLEDYRDVSGHYDRITSVGMYEHVGLKSLWHYFSKLQSLLTADGLVMNHGITTTDVDGGEAPYGGGEFIERYVFPYGELPHIGFVLSAMQEGGLEALDIENLRRHYARTCEIWANNFDAHENDVKRLAGDKHYRIWRVYLAGSAYAFAKDWISLYQVVSCKSGKHASTHPWSRGYMYKR